MKNSRKINKHRQVEETPPTIHQARRAATRERLIQATIELLRREGMTALSTVNIAREAGIVQSGFYMHFKNLDEAKRVAAENVAERIRSYVARHRRRIPSLDAESLDLLRAHCRKMLEIFQTERGFAEVFLHYRYDRSPLGRVMRELEQQLHADLVEDLCFVIYAKQNVPENERDKISLQAKIILAAALVTGESLIEKRTENIDSAADLLSTNITAAVASSFSKQNKN